MISASDVIDIRVSPSELAFASRLAKSAEIGGASAIGSPQRLENLSEDQRTGMLANYAFAKWIGHRELWRIGRWCQDGTPRNGDGGYDLPTLRVDVKGSLLRTNLQPLDHHLWVRQPEWHDGWTYVLALVKQSLDVVTLVGWATSEMFPPEWVNGTHGKPRRELRANLLKPLPPLHWERERGI